MPCHALAVPTSRTVSTGRTFINAAAQVWYSLPDDVAGNISDNGTPSFKSRASNFKCMRLSGASGQTSRSTQVHALDQPQVRVVTWGNIYLIYIKKKKKLIRIQLAKAMIEFPLFWWSHLYASAGDVTCKSSYSVLWIWEPISSVLY